MNRFRTLRPLVLAALVSTMALALLALPSRAASPASGALSGAIDGASTRLAELGDALRSLAPELSAEQLVERALRQSERAGSYRLVADAEQRLLPRSLPRLVGQQEKRVDMRMEGGVELPDRARIEIAVEGRLGPEGKPGSVAILRDGIDSFVEKNGHLEPVQNPAGLSSPTADQLAFLAASERHERLPDGPGGLKRVSFVVDGEGFADFLQEQTQEALAGELPPGAEAARPEGLARMSGQGEVWIDEAGYPIRMETLLYLPEVDEAYDARVTLISTFSDFGEDLGLPRVIEDAAGGFRYGEPAAGGQLGAALREGFVRVSALLTGIALAALAIAASIATVLGGRRRRRVYAAVVTATILGLLSSQGFMALRYRAFGARVAQAAEAPGLVEALTGRAPSQVEEEDPLGPRVQAESSVPPEQITKCGQGSEHADTDGEGLSDYVESCLGTNPINVDSDSDLLNDRLEVDGIQDENGKTWHSDPLLPDSNNDGLHDKDEWPQPHGYAPVLDADGDGLPNFWDPDNDDDGVSDGIDNAPYSYTAYDESFELNTFRPSADVTDTERTQLVFIQVQPEDEAHMRYSLTPLDWSYDDLGQVQVLGQQPRDIQLTPMLSIDTTISPTLSTAYGAVVQENPAGSSYPYNLLLPLSPVGDGGRIEALGGMMGYTPEELDEVVWDASLIWVFTGNIDTGVNCDDEGRNCSSYQTQKNTLVQYKEESYRITGLSVQLSSDTKIAAVTTPEERAEDYDLLQAFLGLNETYLQSARGDMDASAPDYSTIESSLANLTGGDAEARFGITTTISAVSGQVQSYENSVDAWQLFGAETETFLNGLYERCVSQEAGCLPDNPTVLYLTESDSGVYTLDAMAEDAAGDGAYSSELDELGAIDIETIRVATVRGTRIQMYEWQANEWAALSLQQTLDIEEARYPDISPSGLALMRLAYAAWSSGINNVVAMDEVDVDVEIDYHDAVNEINKIAVQGRTVGIWFGERAENLGLELSEEVPAPTQTAALAGKAAASFGAVAGALDLAVVVMELIDLAERNEDLEPYITGFEVASKVITILEKSAALVKQISTLRATYANYQAPVEEDFAIELEEINPNFAVGDDPAGAGGGAAEEMAEAGEEVAEAGSAFEWIPVIGLVVAVIVAVVVYFLTISQDWSDSLLEGYAAAQLIATIVLIVMLYFIAMIPVVGAIIVIIILLITAIVWLITWLVTGKGVNILDYVVEYFADYIFQAAQVTTIGDTEFGDIEANIVNEAMGPIEGNTYRVYTDFEGRIDSQKGEVTTWVGFIPIHHHYTGSSSDVKGSHAYGTWTGYGPGNEVGDERAVPNSIPSNDQPEDWVDRGCTYSDKHNNCKNSVGLDFYLKESGTNVLLKLLTLVDYRLAFKEVIIDGLIPIQTVYESGTSPDPDASGEEAESFEDAWDNDAIDFYFDVLPAEVEALWEWDDPRIQNLDRDADGLSNDVEQSPTGPGTDWRAWDTDGDGLSDGYEIQGQQTISGTLYGPDPTKANTDADQLDDREEVLVWQTAVNDEDTDGDSLLDHEEVCVDGAASWRIRILTKTVSICGNPNSPDPDGDGLTDAQEKAAGTSPFAFNNKTPVILIDSLPYLQGPNGQTGTYLRGGESAAITMTVRNIVANEAGGEVELCLGQALGSPTVLQHPADSVSPGGCSFRGQTGTKLSYAEPSAQGAELQSAYQATAAGGDSLTVTAHVQLPFTNSTLDPPVSNQTISQTSVLTIDNEKPAVEITEPALLRAYDPPLTPAIRGERYVLGGTATDDWSWIDQTDVSVRSGASTIASWRFTKTGTTGRWSAAWDLPADGSYTIQASATDAVGNASPTQSRPVIVDNTAPTVSIDLADGGWLQDIDVDARGRVTATVPIQAADNLAGLDLLQVSLDGRPFQRVDLGSASPYPTSASVDFAWTFPGIDSQGSHTIVAQAYDRAGNLSAQDEKTLILDLTPPLSLQSNYTPAVDASAAVSILGHADETAGLPPPAHPGPISGTLDAMADATVWEQFPDDASDAQAQWLGDFNGDARSDFVIGLPDYDDDGDGSPEGRVIVVFGKAGGWQVPPQAELLDEDATTFVGAAGAGIGAHVGPAGDVDGDGIDDLLIGDPTNNRVFVEYGVGGPQGNDRVLDGATANRTEILGPEGTTIGAFAASAGDVNADGLADLLVVSTGSAGHASLIASWPRLRGQSVDLAKIAARRFPMPAGGAPAVRAGDLDGDGYGDYALADPTGSLATSGGQPAIQLVRGTRWVTQTTPMSTPLRGAAPLGALLSAAGDVNGDGYDDLAYGSGDGAQVALGAASLGSLQSRSLGVDAADLTYLAGVGDLNPGETKGQGKTLDDLVVGTSDGSARVIHGADPFPSSPLPVATIQQAMAMGASPYAGGADANCDGSADLLVVPPAEHVGSLDTLASAGPGLYFAPDALRAARDAGARGATVRTRPATDAAAFESTGTGLLSGLFGLLGPQAPQAQGAATAKVSVRYCASCDNDGLVWGSQAFASIGAALDAGATRVLVDKGLYEESFTIGAGASVRGVGAGATIVQAPASLGGGDPVVTLEGAGAALSGLAIVGTSADGGTVGDGVHATSGSGLEISRLLVRNAAQGILLQGSGTQATIDTTTLVNNASGLVSRSCAPVDLRNSILAYHSVSGATYQVSACPQAGHRLRFSGFWANAEDLTVDGAATDPSDVGEGQVPADPRFLSVSSHDYRLQLGSPMIDAGQPGDAVPPGTGSRVDLGYAEYGAAAAYAGADYCETCDNDGLVWQVNAFATIGEAVAAARGLLGTSGCATGVVGGPPCGTVLSVGVAAGSYDEQVRLPSDVRLVGAGADVTTIDPGLGTSALGSAVVISNARRVEITGFTIRGFGGAAGSAGVLVAGASSAVTLSRNLIVGRFDSASDAAAGVAFQDQASGALRNNTIVNTSRGVLAAGSQAISRLDSNLLSGYQSGIVLQGDARALSEYNLLDSSVSGAQDYSFVGDKLINDGTDITGQDPLFVGTGATPYHLQAGSPAIGAGNPQLPALVGAGDRTTIGYWQRLVAPVALHFGEEGERSCQDGNSGVARVRVGLSRVEAPSDTLEATTPSSWQDASLDATGSTGRYWSLDVAQPGAEGLYRLYTQSTDNAGNPAQQMVSELLVDASAPTLRLIEPTGAVNGAGAALYVKASVTDVVDAAGVPRFTVAGTSFLLDEGQADAQTIPGAWTAESWSIQDGTPRDFEGWIPLSAGNHDLQIVVRNAAGLETRSNRLQIGTSGTDVATLISPVDGQSVNARSIDLRGYARLASAGERTVTAYVNGAEVGRGSVVGSGTVGSFELPITLPSGSSFQVQIVVGGGSLASAPVTTIGFDPTPPQLAVDTPTSDGPEAMTYRFTGTAKDDASGPPVVEISFDGGYEWLATATTSTSGGERDWSLTWVLPGDIDAETFPVYVRARDGAGNVTQVFRPLLVDNVPPRSPEILSLSPAEGSYTEDPFVSLDIRWVNPVIDGSGPATVEAAVVKDSAALPGGSDWKPAQNGCSTTGQQWGCDYKQTLSGTGAYTLYLKSSDPAGNYNVTSYGPFHVGSAPPFALGGGARPLVWSPTPEVWEKAIRVDGRLEIAAGEWQPGAELLGDDERGRRAQSLWTSWDARSLYLGWQGANAQGARELQLYLDTGPGGGRLTALPAAPSVADASADAPAPALPTLPFDADLALLLDGSAEGRLLRWTGEGWRDEAPEALGLRVATDLLRGEAEARLGLGAEVQGERGLGAFALVRETEAGVTSVLPTSNALEGPWDEAYRWDAMRPGLAPAFQQPGMPLLDLQIAPDHGRLVPRGPGDVLSFRVQVSNQEREALDVERFEVETNEGATILGQSGATCLDCPNGGRLWRMAVENVPAQGVATVAVTVAVPADLAGIDELRLRARAYDRDVVVTESELSSPLDALPPTIAVLRPRAKTLRPGPGQVGGRTEDLGVGIAMVEVRQLPDGPWRLARGTRSWTIDVDAPDSGTLRFEARATDPNGRQATSETFEVTVDPTPPTARVIMPGVVSGPRVLIRGLASDGFPSDGALRAVQVSVDAGPWGDALLEGLPTGGYGWRHLWSTRGAEIGLHEVQVRVRDMAGNWSEPSEPHEFVLEHEDAADLSVTQSAELTGPVAGGRIRFEVRTANAGPGPAEEVVVVTGIPAETRLVNAPPTCAQRERALICTQGTLPAGEEVAIRFEVRVNDDIEAGWIRHYASVHSLRTRDPYEANNRSDSVFATGRPTMRPIYLPYTHVD